MNAEIIAHLRKIPKWADSNISLRHLSGGITNRNFVANIDNKEFVVRIPGARTELLGIDRRCEAQATILAADLGIAPKVIGEFQTFGTLIVEFVDGQHLVGTDFTRRLPEVVELVKKFHSIPKIDGQFPIHRIVEAHARDAKENGVLLPRLWEPLHQTSLDIEKVVIASGVGEAPCHNDLLPTNVLFGANRSWLLDFEYAGMNNPYFDLGNLSVNSELDGGGDEQLLECYFGCVSARHIALLGLMKVMSELREGMWAVVQQAISTLDTDFVAYADQRLFNCQRIATGEDFDGWMNSAVS